MYHQRRSIGCSNKTRSILNHRWRRCTNASLPGYAEISVCRTLESLNGCKGKLRITRLFTIEDVSFLSSSVVPCFQIASCVTLARTAHGSAWGQISLHDTSRHPICSLRPMRMFFIGFDNVRSLGFQLHAFTSS